MPQHDYDIANKNGATVRGDINDVLDAILTNNSGSTAPNSLTTQAFQFWADTSANNELKIRNAANNDWITIGKLNLANLGLMLKSVYFPSITDTVNTTSAQLNVLTGINNGVAVANKALVVDGSKDIDLGSGDLTATKLNAENIRVSTDIFINNASGHGRLEVGGTTGAYIDLKAPNATDYDLRLASWDPVDGDDNWVRVQAKKDRNLLLYCNGTGYQSFYTNAIQRLRIHANGDIEATNSGKFKGDGSALTGISPGGLVFADSGTSFYQIDGTQTFDCLLTAVGGGGSGAVVRNEDYADAYCGGGGGGGVFKASVKGATKIAWTVGAGGTAQTSDQNKHGNSGANTTITITGGSQAGTIICPKGNRGIFGFGSFSGTLVTGTSSLVSDAFTSVGIRSTDVKQTQNYNSPANPAWGGLAGQGREVGLVGVGGMESEMYNATLSYGKTGCGYGSGGSGARGARYSKSGAGANGVVMLEMELG